jgi:UDP-3-O-[3-hydroxymyristoyl] glucosamine N-acyltransferase
LSALRGETCLLKIVLHIARILFKDIIMKLSELAKKTHSAVESGSPETEIESAAGLDIAGPSQISFLANPKYTPQVDTTKAGAIFLSEGVEINRNDLAVLRAKDAYLAYTRALRIFNPEMPVVPGVHQTAVIDATADVAGNVEISANVVIGKNCRIESGVKIFPNVTIYNGVTIGENSVSIPASRSAKIVRSEQTALFIIIRRSDRTVLDMPRTKKNAG